MKILTPRQIYEEIRAGNINIENGLDLLIYIVENERERELRASGFMYLQKLKPTSIRYFQFLERLLLSDLDDYIRKLAASTLIDSFALKAYDVIRWALSHEHSSQCIVSMVDLIKECNEKKLKSLLKEIEFVIFDDKVIFPTRSNHLINLNQKSINKIKDLFGLENLHQIEELYLQDNNILLGCFRHR